MEAMVEKPGTEVPYGFLSLYELEGDVDEIMTNLDDEATRMDLPEWFDEIKFASWNCYSLGEKVSSKTGAAS